MRKDAPLAIDVPTADRDRPGWVKVGVIAAIGFVVGIAWPRIVGVRLGPSAPGEAASAAAASGAPPTRAPEAPPASVGARPPGPAASNVAPSAVASAPAAPAAPPQLHIGKGSIIGCKTDDGDNRKGRDCGTVGSLDLVVLPRIKKLTSCAGAEGQSGKLSVVVTADFATGRFTHDVGKSSTVGNLEAIGACLKTNLTGVSVSGIPHEHPRYTVAYTAVFTSEPKEAKQPERNAKDGNEKGDAPAAAEPPTPAPTPTPAASGEATVAWEVALVRDTPKTGQVVGRLPRGTKVKLGSLKDGWYAIKFGDGFATDGWVYRGSIGR